MPTLSPGYSTAVSVETTPTVRPRLVTSSLRMTVAPAVAAAVREAAQEKPETARG